MIKAVALFSGGLDSQLAVLLVRDQGVEVLGITFATPFFTPETAVKAARDLDVPLEIVDITEEHLEIVKNPRHGYGKNLNPCIDCHALMVKKAGEYMEKTGAHFIITGEVLGERPMSQNFKALRVVEKESGFEGLVLRPLSARLLPPTLPEEKGWIDREKLENIQGRSRKPQMALAEKYGLKEYPSPAGGCLLTVESFSNKLKDLIQHQEKASYSDLELLKIGRHFRLGEKVKIIVGRDHQENQKIFDLAEKGDFLLKASSIPGPTTLLRGEVKEEQLGLAASITARYSDASAPRVAVEIKEVTRDDEKEIRVNPLEDEEINKVRVN
ncbi:MAG: DUF814 domain-containing protein [Candidatus Syntrophonatronum acetioxidans]|uniref:DUF814 domain-containing protein n=1 Tax=Candidatus Syntrophonatronum acetioxidans TaxID=1795816 RepID=A0A424YEL6_9FIRM|nr:MAG: DUF814 domain-containing protein [Candidatus Syntrophonatronum acetioxidans]